MTRISAYLPTYNARDGIVPVGHLIESLLIGCDELVVADGGSTDGTWDDLGQLRREHRALQVHRFAAPGGQDEARSERWLRVLKGYARAACTGDVCLEAWTDLEVPRAEWPRLHAAATMLTADAPLLALPILHLWDGSDEMLRQLPATVPCLSLNLPRIGHRAAPQAPASGHDYMDLRSEEAVASRDPVPEQVRALRGLELTDAEFRRRYSAAVHAQGLPLLRSHRWSDLLRALQRQRRQEPSAPAAEPFSGRTWGELSDADLDQVCALLRRCGPTALGDDETKTS